MTCNPFMAVSEFNLPLQEDICQRIYYAALRATMRGAYPDTVPDSILVAQLRQWTSLNGPSVCLLHPADIKRIFAGVTLNTYQAIESLCCSQVGRGIGMVWRILREMALQVNTAPLKYEAVWSICLYLEDNRAASTAVTAEQMDATWQVVRVNPPILARNGDGAIFRPVIICVLDTGSSKVLAFRIAESGEIDESVSLALYDAIVAQRCPSVRGATGLLWQLPAWVVTDVPVSKACQDACNQVGFSLKPSNGTAPLPLLDALHGDWARDLQGRVLEKSRLVTLFDNYLEKGHGHGPLASQSRKKADFAHLVGYSADPAWQFPALRRFLPAHTGIIRDGAVEYDGLHYEDKLLGYWPGQPAILRRSEVEEKSAWVYLDDDILCQAMARELRRTDGSYRPNRQRSLAGSAEG